VWRDAAGMGGGVRVEPARGELAALDRLRAA
jgi:hypothetical protein